MLVREKLERLLACPWADVALPDQVAALPTMLMLRERQLLYWLARHYVKGSGRIVDGGCFLGGSTASFASGLAAREKYKPNKTIASYDLYRVEPYTLSDYRDCFSDTTIGASFRKDFETNIAPWSRHVETCEGDVTEIGWSGQRIEVLFIDFAKTWRINDVVLAQFLPNLIPGHSIIVQQDYMWGFGPWIHITMELLAESVTILDSMLCSVAYLVTGKIPRNIVGMNLRSDLSDAMKMELMDSAVNRWTGQKRGLVELARVMLISEIFSRATAEDELARVLKSYPDDNVVRTCGQRVAGDIAGEPWWTL